jgi:putative transposase
VKLGVDPAGVASGRWARLALVESIAGRQSTGEAPRISDREVLDLDIGDSEDEIFWTTFLRRLKERGLTGVLLVISDAHSGLKAAISKTLIGATWQRCRVHTMRNLLAHVPKGHAEMVAATVRTIFAQPDAGPARSQLRMVSDSLRDRYPGVADVLDETEADLTAYADYLRAHCPHRSGLESWTT